MLLAVHKGHAPIRSVSRQIQNITSKDLDVRLDPQTVPIELEQLVLSFNHMIERIEGCLYPPVQFLSGYRPRNSHTYY